MGYKGDYGQYHSVYDSFDWMDKFGDPGFKWHATLARTFGLIVLRLADSPVLAFDFTDYAEQMNLYIGELEKQAATTKHGADVDFKPLRRAVELFSLAAIQLEVCACLRSNTSFVASEVIVPLVVRCCTIQGADLSSLVIYFLPTPVPPRCFARLATEPCFHSPKPSNLVISTCSPAALPLTPSQSNPASAHTKPSSFSTAVPPRCL